MSQSIGVNLRIQVIKARNLAAKDRNGKSDPFVVISLPGSNPPASTSTSTTTSTSVTSTPSLDLNPDPKSTWKKQTPIVSKSLDPEWKLTETTYDLPILSKWLADAQLVSLLESKRLDMARGIQDQEQHEGNMASSLDVTQASEGSEAGAGEKLPTPPLNTTTSQDVLSTDTLASGTGTGTGVRPSMSRHSSKLAYLSSSSKKLLSAPVKLIKVPNRLSRNNSSNQVPFHSSSNSHSEPEQFTNLDQDLGGVGGRKRAPRPMTIRRRRRNQGGNLNGGKDGKGVKNPNPNGISQGSLGNVEFVLWDHDRFSGNDYLGEVSLDILKWSRGGEGIGSKWEDSEPLWLPLTSSRRSSKISGELQVRIGLVSTSSTPSSMDLDEIYQRLALASSHPLHLEISEDMGEEIEDSIEMEAGASGEDEARLEVRHIPASESVGTTTNPNQGFNGLDDGLSSDSEESDEEEEDGDTATEGEETDLDEAAYEEHYQSIAAVGKAGDVKAAPALTPPSSVLQEGQTKSLGTPTPTASAQQSVSQRRKVFGKKSNTNTSSSSGINTESSSGNSFNQQSSRKRLGRKKKVVIDPETGEPLPPSTSNTKVRRKKSNRKKDLSFQAEMGKDIIGIVMMEVKGAEKLPRWKNALHTSFDMDPFTIVSFGQKIFRTRVARHTLNPIWDEKLLFHVRRHEIGFQAKFAVYDWDKMSSNDHVGSCSISIKELIEKAPKPNEETGLYDSDLEDSKGKGMNAFTLPLEKREDDDDHKYGSSQPTLTVEARFTPYAALRQRLWRQLLKQFDTNDSGTMSTLEMATMLDSLGSTLTTKTLHSWWEILGKKSDEDELSIDESIVALERELVKHWSEKRTVNSSEGSLEDGAQTPSGIEDGNKMEGLDLTTSESPSQSQAKDSYPALQEEEKDQKNFFREREGSSSSDFSLLKETSESPSVERVIRLKSCPLCHMSRLNSKAEVDIVTHLAVCASQDWKKIDTMTSGVSNFVTASQAHRKWYTKVVNKVSQGSYQLGADSANIIVQDRITGELLEEKMQVYVRLGIRLLYRGAKSRMEGQRIKKMLKNMSIKQGVKFDNPNSVRDIAPFIAFHQLNMEEVLDPIESFKTFNEFFFRKIKPDARPNDDPDDPTTLVSGADCRMMAFESVDEATRIWIKGKEFSVERLLGDDYKGKLEKYKGGSLCIFRLAPQDYHRFHVPVDGTIGEIKRLDGQYYTVNPMAVRSSIDIYGENIRSVVPFHSKEFGTVFQVCVGAMMVGSTVFTAQSHQQVKRGDELGYYKFGGSTNILLFEKGRNQFDQDLLDNSSRSIETLVRVGMRVGKALKEGATTP